MSNREHLSTGLVRGAVLSTMKVRRARKTVAAVPRTGMPQRGCFGGLSVGGFLHGSYLSSRISSVLD